MRSKSSHGKLSSLHLVSWMARTSQSLRSSHASTRSARARREFTFQVAIFTATNLPNLAPSASPHEGLLAAMSPPREGREKDDQWAYMKEDPAPRRIFIPQTINNSPARTENPASKPTTPRNPRPGLIRTKRPKTAVTRPVSNQTPQPLTEFLAANAKTISERPRTKAQSPIRTPSAAAVIPGHETATKPAAMEMKPPTIVQREWREGS